MLRPTRTALVALPVALLLLAGGCSSGDKSQSEVRDDIEQDLLSSDREGPEVSDEEASDIAECVSADLFESGDYTAEERQQATQQTDGDVDPELEAKVEATYADCGLPE